MKVPTPRDDPRWPQCKMAQGERPCAQYSSMMWCVHIRDRMLMELDGNLFFGTRVIVPIMPEQGLFAEVSIDSETIADTLAALALVREEDAFSQDEELIPLGMYTRGEGRVVIVSAINDWVETQEKPKCTAASHGYEEEMAIQNMENRAPDNEHAVFWKANGWCIVYFKMCYPCFQAHNAPGPISPDNFGLNGLTGRAPRSGNPSRPNNRNRTAGGQINTQGTPSATAPTNTRDLLRQRTGAQPIVNNPRNQVVPFRKQVGIDDFGTPLYINPRTGKLIRG